MIRTSILKNGDIKIEKKGFAVTVINQRQRGRGNIISFSSETSRIINQENWLTPFLQPFIAEIAFSHCFVLQDLFRKNSFYPGNCYGWMDFYFHALFYELESSVILDLRRVLVKSEDLLSIRSELNLNTISRSFSGK